MRTRLLASLGLAVLGICALMPLSALPANARAASPGISKPSAALFTCPASGVACVYPNDDFSGNYGSPWNGPGEITAPLVQNETWYAFSANNLKMSPPNPGSITNHLSACIWVYSFSLSKFLSIKTQTRAATDNSYGYVYVDFSHTNCSVHPSAP
jgi:hypothetical protein